ncbi:fungal-specific transcription factor domain-containing protein [Aspergillus pseudotamarii]|uniref:Fungal-specific transcription factor domain-containing protein n=1 Tax=Aspergillus pseudotamarii TaxID=132259 RepID=A0A5N6T694_ASPPS|nr:fungal-specific transcription factor domain-containing protein [Aspergillus pseudotamarii]KAE8141832.1 fungal-specific transcription factor domain-containing protein [Aspergillus pseudotamarii]
MSTGRLGDTKVRKHTKTFTGCWTCRARRIRCDETKPQCLQCFHKGCKCEGYGVRLQWVRNDADEQDGPYPSAARSNIVPDSRRVVFPSSHIDEILHTLDLLAYDGTANPREEVSHFIDCFGVLGTAGRHRNSTSISSQTTAVSHPVQLESLPSWSPLGLAAVLGGQQDRRLESVSAEISGDMPTPPLHDSYESQTLLAPSQGLPPTPFLVRPTSSHLSSDENFLMYHYSHRVLYLFCVIDHEKSPWKIVHLPIALQAMGELSMQGSTSMIREALLCTLLAISSFLLSNDGQSHVRTDDALSWRAAASKYRCKAINLLRNAVECYFYAKSPPRYKEFLATTLSMITMDVISGDTDTCGIHLNGCFRLITQAQKWKRKYSTKAQTLHRIYFYLRTIYESTAPRSSRRTQDLPFAADTPGDGSPDIFCRDLLGAQMSGFPAGIDMDLETRMSSCERIYGIPHGLLILLIEVIELTDKLDEVRDADSVTQVSDSLMEECDQLGKAIIDWPAVVGLEGCTKINTSVSAKIVHQHTLAFHNALIIYFAQNIRQVGHHFLLPYVNQVLNSMETVESLKVGTQEALAAPLFWPVFIAASATFDVAMQDRFRSWYSHVKVYRIEGFRTGLHVLEDLWKTGPSHQQQQKCHWRQVLEKTGVRLMLS